MTPTHASAPRVCVVGAGPSGITAAKALRDKGIDTVVYERRSRVGGLWAISDATDQASYPSLECNTSKRRTQFSDFPMPRDYPPYPHNTQMAAYFDAYVDHFDLRDSIVFDTAVEHAGRSPGGGWDVRLSSGAPQHVDALVVASGHHREPRWATPALSGTFSGRQLHAHDYAGPQPFREATVVVLGMGNSAMDIAVELSGAARTVYLAARRGVHIVPKFALGAPIDMFNSALPVPWAVKRALFTLILRGTIGRPQDVGLPAPDHRLGEAHPTISQRISERVRAGTVIPKPGIVGLSGDMVRFADGSEVRADAVIHCTGYNVSFPFLDDDVISPADNRVALFHQVFVPGIDDIAFIGLIQPFGALMPIAEEQALWVAERLSGQYRLPPREVMLEQIERDREARDRRFVASPRHTLEELDPYAYVRRVRRERRRGALVAA